MNIQPIKPEPASLMAKPKAAPVKETREEAARDTVKLSVSEGLLQALRNEPEVRLEEVARGKDLVSNPDYPSDELLKMLAGFFVDDSRNNANNKAPDTK